MSIPGGDGMQRPDVVVEWLQPMTCADQISGELLVAIVGRCRDGSRKLVVMNGDSADALVSLMTKTEDA